MRTNRGGGNAPFSDAVAVVSPWAQGFDQVNLGTPHMIGLGGSGRLFRICGPPGHPSAYSTVSVGLPYAHDRILIAHNHSI